MKKRLKNHPSVFLFRSFFPILVVALLFLSFGATTSSATTMGVDFKIDITYWNPDDIEIPIDPDGPGPLPTEPITLGPSDDYSGLTFCGSFTYDFDDFADDGIAALLSFETNFPLFNDITAANFIFGDFDGGVQARLTKNGLDIFYNPPPPGGSVFEFDSTEFQYGLSDGPLNIRDQGGGSVTYSAAAPVPEPATLLLLGSGLVGLAGFRRKLKK